jgi:hypothetical protein
MKPQIILILAGVLIFSSVASPQPCDPPEIVHVYSSGGNVIIDFQTSSPPALLGFNFYRNGEFLEYLPYTGDSVYTQYFTTQPPGIHEYCITSVCELTNDGYPADTIESEPDCETVDCIYGFDLPFEEDWSLGSFSTSDWVKSSDNWIISEDTGNSPPSATFVPLNPETDYNETLESYYLNAYGMTEGHIFLEYDLSLSSTNSSGTEHFLIQVWNHESQEYVTVKNYSNQDGSFVWERDTLNIKGYSMGRVFKIRFVAQGENSSNINYWGIDNINVYRECGILEGTLESYLVNDTCIELEFIQNSQRDLIDIITYVQKDGDIIAIYSMYDPIPNPYCVGESGEYCFFMSYAWASESDFCESDFTEPTCQQVIINDLADKTNSVISLLFNPLYEILRIESPESIDNLDIYDLSGRHITSANPGSTYFNMDVSDIKPGLYLVRIKTLKLTTTRKLIIK